MQRELSFDQGWPDADRVHRLVVERQGLPGWSDGSFDSLDARAFDSLRVYFSSEVESLMRVAPTGVKIKVDSSPVYTLHFVEPMFQELLPLEIVSGNLEEVLRNPGLLAIEESLATALGEDARLGETLLLKPASGEGEQEYVVGAIFRHPGPVSLRFGMLTLLGENPPGLFVQYSRPWESSVKVWLKLREGISTEGFNARQPAFIEANAALFHLPLPPDARLAEHLSFRLQALADLHFNPLPFEANSAYFGDRAKLLTFAVVGVLVLLVGCSNSASLSLAQVLDRRREIGIRKACGAGKADILLHFLAESVVLSLASFVLAMRLMKALLQPVMGLLAVRGEFDFALVDYALLAGVCAAMGLANALYPAFVLSEVRPEFVLRPERKGGARASFRSRSLLVGAQFSLALLFLTVSLALYAQLRVTQAQPLDWDPIRLLLVGHNGLQVSRGSALLNRVGELPGVLAVSPSYTFPNANAPAEANAFNLIRKGEIVSELKLGQVPSVPGFLEMLEIPLLAGRYFDSERDVPASPVKPEDSADARPHSLILNAAAARALGFASPEEAVGQLLFQRLSRQEGGSFDVPKRVVGVLKDNMFSSLHRRPLPEVYTLLDDTGRTTSLLFIKYEPAFADNVEQQVSELISEATLATPMIMFVEPRIEAAFERERSEGRLLLSAAGVALLLSCVGLYGLAAATMAKSVKEVGVRKALGAGVSGVVLLFLWRFSKPVLLANLLAWPVAGYFVIQWIQRFPYQLDLAWLPPLFLGASLLVLLVAWLTVAGVTARAAMRAPVQSLRYE